MRAVERDVLLFLLAIGAGAADGWSYTGLGHAFVANMTGNTVLLGLAVFQHRDLLHPATAVGCYAVGTILATLFTRHVGPGRLWTRAVSWTLLIEGLLLGTAACGWLALQRECGFQGSNLNILLGLVAFAIGMQSGTMLQLKIPGVVTTYITGTWTTLMSGIVRLRTVEQRKPAGERVAFEERLLMQGGILMVYFLSAILTGFLSQRAPEAMGFLPSGSVLLTALYGFARS